MTARDELIAKLETIYCRIDHRRGDVHEAIDHYEGLEFARFAELHERDLKKIKQRDDKIEELRRKP